MTLPANDDSSIRPLEAEVRPEQDGWSIRLPLRTETVRVEKRVVIAEEVRVRRQTATRTARIQTRLRRERLRVETSGEPGEIELRRTRPDA